MDAADAARPEEADPRRACDRQRSPDRGRADPALRRAGGEVSRAELARAWREALELLRPEADANLAVQHADRRGHRAGGAHGSVALYPDLDAVRRGEPVRDEGRLERDDGPSLLEGGAHLLREDDQLAHGIDPSPETHRDAASSARPGPSTIQPAASASPAPVESTTRSTGRAARSSPAKEHPRAPRLRIHARPGNGPPMARSSSSFANTTSGASSSTVARNAPRPASRIASQDARSTLTDARARAGELHRPQRRVARRLASEHVPGDEEVVAPVEPLRVDRPPAGGRPPRLDRRPWSAPRPA